MENKLEVSSMLMISKAGCANKQAFDALKKVRKQDYKEGYILISEAKISLREAQTIHQNLLTDFANGEQMELNVLLVHAQDYLMNGVLLVDLVEELIEVFKEFSDTFERKKII